MKAVPWGPEPAATDPSAERSTMSSEIWASPHEPKVPVCPEVFHQALPPATIVPSSLTDCRQQPTGTAFIPCVAVQRKEPKLAPGGGASPPTTEPSNEAAYASLLPPPRSPRR